MAEFTPKPGSGTLFKNNKKAKDTHPDRNGNIFLDEACMKSLIALQAQGKPLKLDLSGWVKKTSSGDQYVSLAVKPAWVPQSEQEPSPTKERSVKSVALDLDDEIPF